MKTPAKSREKRNEKRSKNRRKKATVSYPITLRMDRSGDDMKICSKYDDSPCQLRATRDHLPIMYSEIHSLYFFGQLSIISQYIHFSRPSSISLQYLQLKIEVRDIRSS